MDVREAVGGDRTGVADVNLASLEFWEQSDMDAVFARLRRDDPVSWHEHPDSGRGFWSIVRHADIAELSGDYRRLSNREGPRTALDMDMNEARPGTDSIIELDPPEHSILRRVVNRGFTPRAVAALEGSIRERSRSIVEDIADRGRCDFVQDAAALLPLNVICDLVGVPDGDRAHVYALTNKALGVVGSDVGQRLQEAAVATLELKAYGSTLAADRRKHPREDLLTRLTTATTADDRALSPEEVGGFFSLLIAAGNETTRNALTFGLLAFTKHPDQRSLFMSEPALRTGAAEELIRWASPLLTMRRTATEDMLLRDIEIRAGDKIALWYFSANRDETVFPAPNAFDITRNPNLHQAFGGGGPHYCLGANLARLELIVFFQELFKILPDIHAIGEPLLARSNEVRSASQLQATFTPR